MELHWLSAQHGDEWKHFDDWINWSFEMTGVFDEKECYQKWRSFSIERDLSKTFASFVATAQENNPEKLIRIQLNA